MGIFKYKKLIVVVLVIFLTVMGVGIYFAMEKGEPEYKSKIDKIIYDTKNKSPKYVITMPERTKRVIEQVKNPPISSGVPARPEKEVITLQDLFDNIPTLSKIVPAATTSPLKYVSNVAAMVEGVDGLEIPKVSINGRKPWTEYGKKVQIQPNFYKVSIIIKNMGMDLAMTELLIKGIPANVSMSFSPYGRNLVEKIKMAREYGHETYVDLLLPSKDFLREDTGPLSLSTTASDDEILSRVRKTIGLGAPIGGVMVDKGYVGDDNLNQLQMVLNYIKECGLLMLDATNENGIDRIEVTALPRNKADIIIDSNYTKANIAKKLELAEMIAKEQGHVLIVVDAKPLPLAMIDDWVNTFSEPMSYEEAKNKGIDIKNIDKPFTLAPASSVVIE